MEDLFEILTNSRRRAVIRYLSTEASRVELCDLVRYVAGEENGISPTTVTVRQRNRVRTALYQHHLEKMDEMGVLEYDKRAGVVRRTEMTERIDGLLDRAGSDQTTLVGYALGALTLGIAMALLLVPEAATVMAIALGGIGSGFVLVTYRSGCDGLV